MATPAVTAKVLRFVDGQKILLNSLGQNFPAGNFDSFEETLDGLTSHDVENKKLVLDQVEITIIFPLLFSYPFSGCCKFCCLFNFIAVDIKFYMDIEVT